jgi:hypothetical protein
VDALSSKANEGAAKATRALFHTTQRTWPIRVGTNAQALAVPTCAAECIARDAEANLATRRRDASAPDRRNASMLKLLNGAARGPVRARTIDLATDPALASVPKLTANNKKSLLRIAPNAAADTKKKLVLHVFKKSKKNFFV